MSKGPASTDSAASSAEGRPSASSVLVSAEIGTGAESPSTRRAASANSASTSVKVTSAKPMGGRFAVPLKIQSAILSARSDLVLCSPSTQEMASTIFDLPHPFGPTMQLKPVPLKVRCVFSQKDLKPMSSTLRSLSKRPYPPPFRAKETALRQIQYRFPREEGARDESSGGSYSGGPAVRRLDRR